jgi:hypothetical protein
LLRLKPDTISSMYSAGFRRVFAADVVSTFGARPLLFASSALIGVAGAAAVVGLRGRGMAAMTA